MPEAARTLYEEAELELDLEVHVAASFRKSNVYCLPSFHENEQKTGSQKNVGELPAETSFPA